MTDLDRSPRIRQPLLDAQSAVDAALTEVLADLGRRWRALTPDGSASPGSPDNPASHLGLIGASTQLTADDVLGYLVDFLSRPGKRIRPQMCFWGCLLYTSDAADERSSVDLGGRRIIKKKKINVTALVYSYTHQHHRKRASV